MKADVWAVDRFRFRVSGKNVQQFLNRAASCRIRLSRLRWEKEGLSAQAGGTDYRKIRTLAETGGWEFSVQRRVGPGFWAEQILSRPGLWVGALLFLTLVQGMEQIVWSIQFGNLSADTKDRMRTLLAECGIHEGTVLDAETLAAAQNQALQQSDVLGWISLNFTDGCLSMESTEAQYQTIREEPPLTPLYARLGGQILAVEAESGFPLVTPGQQVETGQMLVDVARLDRDGNQVLQGASGRIVARCEKSYTSTQNFRTDAVVLNGKSGVQDTLYLMNWAWKLNQQEVEGAQVVQTEWLPLQWGRVSLPGCIRRETVWFQEEQQWVYTPQQAEALARRDCRTQLYREFPDAEIETEQCTLNADEKGVSCTITYRFCANITTEQSE